MKRILVLVDCQNDFIDGVLGTKEAVAVVPNIVKKIKQLKSDHEIFVTKDTHDYTYKYTFEGRNLPIEHCIQPLHGWCLNEDIYNAITEGYTTYNVIEKNSFGSMDLPEAILNYVKEGSPELFEITLFGFCTDICVITNALLLRTYFPEHNIIVDSSCCAGTTPEMHEAALKVMRSCQIDIV